MKLWLSVLILTFGCFLPSSGEESGGKVLVSKNILSQYIVEGKDVTVEYKIYNQGSSVVYNVMLNEYGFPESHFKLIHGSYRVTWDRLASLTDVTHALIVRPIQTGYYNFTSAEISYVQVEEKGDRIFGSSSFPGRGIIIPSKDFDRRFSSRTLDWLVFAFMTLPSLGMPFLLWHRSKSQYEDAKLKSG